LRDCASPLKDRSFSLAFFIRENKVSEVYTNSHLRHLPRHRLNLLLILVALFLLLDPLVFVHFGLFLPQLYFFFPFFVFCFFVFLLFFYVFFFVFLFFYVFLFIF